MRDLIVLLASIPIITFLTHRVGRRNYPVGATAKFLDDSATVPRNLIGERMVLAEGVITGEPVETRDGVLVPVWATREDDDATTVYVNEDNIIDVTEGKIP